MWKNLVPYFAVLAFYPQVLGAQDVAEAPELALPVECELGWNCWIGNYVDHDRTKGSKDYVCGKQTYDAHKGTDFMIRNYADMKKGVLVRAAADGLVLGMRDGMKDIDFRKRPREIIAKKECGNGLRLLHKNGWVTQYCHLRKNSLKVEKGQRVKKGDILGMVGNSGYTMYPHLHFQVEYIQKGSGKRKGSVVDPFVGVARENLCKGGEQPLWPGNLINKMTYRPVSIMDAGFATTVPKLDGMVEGLYQDETLSIRAPHLVLWARILHVKKDDKVTFSIKGPDGSEVFTYTNTLKKDRAHQSLHAGLRRPGYNWDAGLYHGEIKLQRQGTGIFKSQVKVSMR